MAYKKFLVDNITCSRRFHIAYDDEDNTVPRIEVHCPFCDVAIYTAADHPPVKLIREENLVKTSALSENLVTECHFKDVLSERTLPKGLGK